MNGILSILWWGGIYLVAAFFFSWPPFNQDTTLSLSNYENVSVNAYFYYPDNTEVYLGQMRGASACQSAASRFASSKNLSNANWGYICCTIEKGSSCYRKIK